MKLGPYLRPYIKINLKRTKDLNVGIKSIRLYKYTGLHKGYSDKIPTTQKQMKKKVNWTLKWQTFVLWKVSSRKWKDNSWDMR